MLLVQHKCCLLLPWTFGRWREPKPVAGAATFTLSDLVARCGRGPRVLVLGLRMGWWFGRGCLVGKEFSLYVFCFLAKKGVVTCVFQWEIRPTTKTCFEGNLDLEKRDKTSSQIWTFDAATRCEKYSCKIPEKGLIWPPISEPWLLLKKMHRLLLI